MSKDRFDDNDLDEFTVYESDRGFPCTDCPICGDANEFAALQEVTCSCGNVLLWHVNDGEPGDNDFDETDTRHIFAYWKSDLLLCISQNQSDESLN